MPAPRDVTEMELQNILESEDSSSSFRVPLSFSEPRTTKDNAKRRVEVVDVAIHPKFLQKIEKSLLFKNFFMALISESLSEKYNIQINMEKMITLQNRKFMGALVSHRIRNQDVQNVLNSYPSSSEDERKTLEILNKNSMGNNINYSKSRTGSGLVQEIDEKDAKVLKEKAKISTLRDPRSINIKKEISLAACTEPEYKLRAKLNNEKVDEIRVEFFLPNCISSAEFTLDVGEDRILLESMKHGYIFDKFVNYRLKQENLKAIFDKTNKMLEVRIPVYPIC